MRPGARGRRYLGLVCIGRGLESRCSRVTTPGCAAEGEQSEAELGSALSAAQRAVRLGERQRNVRGCWLGAGGGSWPPGRPGHTRWLGPAVLGRVSLPRQHLGAGRSQRGSERSPDTPTSARGPGGDPAWCGLRFAVPARIRAARRPGCCRRPMVRRCRIYPRAMPRLVGGYRSASPRSGGAHRAEGSPTRPSRLARVRACQAVFPASELSHEFAGRSPPD